MLLKRFMIEFSHLLKLENSIIKRFKSMPKITGEPKHPRANRLYNAEWEALPEFRGWLGQSTDEEKGARCKLCQKDLRCHLFDIKKHSETKKHRDIAGDIPEEAYDALPRRQSIPVAIPGMKRKILKMSKSNRKIKKPKKYQDNGFDDSEEEMIVNPGNQSHGPIYTLNVGGEIIMTTIGTLTVYPDSKLAKMFEQTELMIAMPKTKTGHYFLDADPVYFKVVLNFLRLGKITAPDELLKGALELAEELGIAEFKEELDKKDPSKVLLNLNGEKELTIERQCLTRVPESKLAKYFSGEQVKIVFGNQGAASNVLSPWIVSTDPTSFYVSRPAHKSDMVFNFLKAPQSYYAENSDHLQEELTFYGIEIGQHYIIDQSTDLPRFDWIETTE